MKRAITLAALLVCAHAQAQTAKQHYERGSTLYDVGQYREAAREYEEAYKLKSDPALLFNMGQAYRLGGDNVAALRAYKSYLRRSPEASNRRDVEAYIVKLQKLIDEQQATSTGPPTGTLTPQDQPPKEQPPKEQPKTQPLEPVT